MKIWNNLEKWFNHQDRIHDIMRFGLGYTFVSILSVLMQPTIPFLLWSIYVIAQEIKDIIKWTKLGKFKKMWKDGIYDMAWAFSGVFLYAVLNHFSFTHLIIWIITVIIISTLYDKKRRYKE